MKQLIFYVLGGLALGIIWAVLLPNKDTPLQQIQNHTQEQLQPSK